MQVFTLQDLLNECEAREGIYQLDGRALGLEIRVPPALQLKAPYSGSVYRLLQQLRPAIFDYGLISFPDLAFNKTNYTLAQAAPHQHSYSANPYLTGECQHLHQDTPPYPTAFGLDQPRRFYATWLTGRTMCEAYYQDRQLNSEQSEKQRHARLVPQSLEEGTGLLINTAPGLILIDNSDANALYHARTCQFERHAAEPVADDSPFYAFNEVGLLNYIDTLDEMRGQTYRCAEDLDITRAFLQRERL